MTGGRSAEADRWVLLRGLGREAGHWNGFPQALRAAFPAATVLTPDLPGCGIHHRDIAPTRMPGLTEAVRAGLDLPASRSGRPTIWLLGLSLGAMVALDWARRHPDEIAGVVLVNGSSATLSPPWRRLRPAALLALVQAGLARSPTRREERIFDITSARPERAAKAIPAWVALAGAHPLRAANFGRLLLAAATYRPPAEPLPAPTVPDGESAARPPAVLVAVGAEDRLSHPTCSGLLAQALGAQLAVHPTAGHELPLDDPDWLVAQLTRWRAEQEDNSPDRHTVTIG